jgi:opacity protein-like surface antigen
MRRFVLAAVMFGAASGAWAADMPDFLRGSIPPTLSTATRNWDGWYAGGQVGYSSSATDYGSTAVGLTNFTFRDTILLAPTSQLSLFGKANAQGTGFGAFVGRNWQWEDLVFGIEANYNFINSFASSVSASLGPISFATPPGVVLPPNESDSYDVTLSGKAALQIKDVLTFRGRAGWAAGNFLPYVFGGLAVGRMDVQRMVTSDANKTVTIFTTDFLGNKVVQSQTRVHLPQLSITANEERINDLVAGWTGGLGLEYMLWGNVFMRGEWEYIKFLKVKDTVVSMNSARLGIGYKF